jgi:putative (di)nucleoside polyphosphate hydrolase
MKKEYREGVGAVILNNAGLVFIAKRIDTADTWQMPQGGLEKNEVHKVALMRELKEEIGTNNFKIINQINDLIYDLPIDIAKTLWGGKYIGQRQTWFFLEFLGNDEEFNLNFMPKPEFSEWKWVYYQDLIDIIVFFKKSLYQTVVDFGIKNKIFY